MLHTKSDTPDIMLQQRTAGYKALDRLRKNGEFPPSRVGAIEPDLERKTNILMKRFFAERLSVSEQLGGGFCIEELIDRTLRTDEPEIMDSPTLAEREKFELVNALDRQNNVMGIYRLYASMIFPLARELAEKKNRTIKLVELAAGAGGLSLALASEAAKEGLPLSVTGTDIVPAYIEHGNNEARRRQLPVTFRLLDASDMDEAVQIDYDIMLLSQSLHHFTPGQLAVMIASAGKQGASAFIGIDGCRDLLLGIGMPLIAALQGIPAFAMDGLTSARKFYSEAELSLIAEAAAGPGCHRIEHLWPVSFMCVRFDGETVSHKNIANNQPEES
jgi:hypothetical protein